MRFMNFRMIVYLPPYKLPFRLHTFFNFFVNNGLQSKFNDSIWPNQRFYSFFKFNLVLLCKLMEMYGQEKYTIILKHLLKKMYCLTSIIPPFYSLSLSLSHFEWYIRILQIEDNIQSYQWITHWKDCLLK